MHLKSLKVFCDVVGRRSFSRAAEENGISQSGASQVVNQLERHLGTKLIDRSKRPFTLTPEGEIYYGGCRKLVERYFSLEDRVRTLHDEVAGRVRVASIYSVGLHHMDRYLHEFLSLYPKANVRLEYLHPHKVYEAVENDHADLGLVSYPKASRTIKAIGWRQEPMVLVCSPSHPFAKRQHVSLQEVAAEPIVGFDSELTIRREIDRELLEHRSDLNVVMEFDNIETIKRAVEIDAGVSLLPKPTIVREVETGALAAVPLSSPELVRPLGIIHRRGKDLGVTVRRFIEMLRRESPEASSRNGEHDLDDAEHNGHDVNEHGANGHGDGVSNGGHSNGGHSNGNGAAGNGSATLVAHTSAN